MSRNSMFVWQVRVWLLALAAVLVFANARQPGLDKGPLHLSAADAQACVTARAPILRAHLTSTRGAAAARKCQAKVVEGTSVPAQAVGG
jgi:hypothetical protein